MALPNSTPCSASLIAPCLRGKSIDGVAHSAINPECRPADVGSRVGCEEADRSGHFLWPAEAAQGIGPHVGCHLALERISYLVEPHRARVIVHYMLRIGSEYRAGTDWVDGDAFRAERASKARRGHMQCGLRCRVIRRERAGLVDHGTADVDD